MCTKRWGTATSLYWASGSCCEGSFETFRWVSSLSGKGVGILGPPLVSRKLGPRRASCQMGLWCNLLAEPLPELWVPLGVGKLPFVTSLPTVVPPGVQDTPLGHGASPTGSSTWGTGEKGGTLLGAPPCGCRPAASQLFLSNKPQGLLCWVLPQSSKLYS